MSLTILSDIRELSFICHNDADFFDEICLAFELPEKVKEKYKTEDYDISVRFFHEEDEVAVFVYDNEDHETINIDFTPEVKEQIIQFAKQYV